MSIDFSTKVKINLLRTIHNSQEDEKHTPKFVEEEAESFESTHDHSQISFKPSTEQKFETKKVVVLKPQATKVDPNYFGYLNMVRDPMNY